MSFLIFDPFTKFRLDTQDIHIITAHSNRQTLLLNSSSLCYMLLVKKGKIVAYLKASVDMIGKLKQAGKVLAMDIIHGTLYTFLYIILWWFVKNKKKCIKKTEDCPCNNNGKKNHSVEITLLSTSSHSLPREDVFLFFIFFSSIASSIFSACIKCMHDEY